MHVNQNKYDQSGRPGPQPTISWVLYQYVINFILRNITRNVYYIMWCRISNVLKSSKISYKEV